MPSPSRFAGAALAARAAAGLRAAPTGEAGTHALGRGLLRRFARRAAGLR